MDFLSRNRFISLKVWPIKTASFQSAKTTQQGGNCPQHRKATYNPGQQRESRACTGRLQEFSALVTNCLMALQQKRGRVLHKDLPSHVRFQHAGSANSTEINHNTRCFNIRTHSPQICQDLLRFTQVRCVFCSMLLRTTKLTDLPSV